MILVCIVLGLSTLYQLEQDQDVNTVHDMFSDASGHDSEEEVRSISLESLLSDFNLESLHAFVQSMNSELDTEAFNCEGTEVCVLPVSARHSVDRDYQFSVSEIRLYELASRFCWTDSETKEVLRLLKDPSFDPRQIGSDIDSRVSTLLTCFLFSYSFVVFFKKTGIYS